MTTTTPTTTQSHREYAAMLTRAASHDGPGDPVTSQQIIEALSAAGISHQVWHWGPADSGVDEVIVRDWEGYSYGYMPGRTLKGSTRDGIRFRPPAVEDARELWWPTIADMLACARYALR